MNTKDNNKSLCFDSVEEFFECTRENRIDGTCEALETMIHASTGRGPSPAEVASWKNSLPDLAKLLCCPEYYYEETVRECAHCIVALSCFKLLIAGGHFAELKERMEDEDIGKNVCKAFNRKTMSCMQEMIEDPGTFADEQKIQACMDAIDEQTLKLVRRKKQTRDGETQELRTGVRVELEYGLAGGRVDVLLSDPDQNKYVIIELKQWTEENIERCSGEEVQIKDYSSQPHPALKVRTSYREQLQQEAGEEAEIMCLVYLHNQIYEDSLLFDAPSEVLYDEQKFPGRFACRENVIMYSRMRWEKFRERIYFFFQPGEEEEQ